MKQVMMEVEEGWGMGQQVKAWDFYLKGKMGFVVLGFWFKFGPRFLFIGLDLEYGLILLDPFGCKVKSPRTFNVISEFPRTKLVTFPKYIKRVFLAM